MKIQIQVLLKWNPNTPKQGQATSLRILDSLQDPSGSYITDPTLVDDLNPTPIDIFSNVLPPRAAFTPGPPQCL